jgi:hypothetical protein
MFHDQRPVNDNKWLDTMNEINGHDFAKVVELRNELPHARINLARLLHNLAFQGDPAALTAINDADSPGRIRYQMVWTAPDGERLSMTHHLLPSLLWEVEVTNHRIFREVADAKATSSPETLPLFSEAGDA